jgi:hypothetical protein
MPFPKGDVSALPFGCEFRIPVPLGINRLALFSLYRAFRLRKSGHDGAEVTRRVNARPERTAAHHSLPFRDAANSAASRFICTTGREKPAAFTSSALNTSSRSATRDGSTL